MAISKLILNGDVQMDVTSDTVSANRMLNGYTATKNDGTKVTGNIATKSAADMTASGSTVTAAAGYYATATSKNVGAGSAFTPAVTITKNPTISLTSSTGAVTASYAGSSSVTPTVTAGYVAAGTAGTVSTSGTSTYQLTSKAAATYNTSTADQTVASYRWLTGTQTIKSVTTSNLTAANIASGVTVKVGDANNASRITQVTGTYAPAVSSVTVTPTETTQTFNATGVYGYKPVTVNGISSTYVGTGITRRDGEDTTFTDSTGAFYGPSGYYTEAFTRMITTQAAQTIYPSTADQTVASYKWLTGTQTIKSVTTSNLTAANIAEGIVVKVGDSTNASRIAQITGTHSGETSYTATITGATGSSSYCYVTYAGTKRYGVGATFTFKAGETLTIYCRGNNVTINGDNITLSSYSYTYTLPVGDITIDIAYSSSTNNSIAIYSLIQPTGTYSVSAAGNHNVYKYSVASIPTGSAFPPATTITTNPSFTLVSSTAKITAAYNGTSYVTPTVTSGWVAAGMSGVISTTGTSTFTLTSQAAQTITPTETSQTIASYRWLTGTQTIAAISSTYVGTGIAKKSSADTTFASATGTFTAPIGYYSAAATKTITTQAAQTFYPSTADQTVTSYRWLTGTQTFKSVTTTNLTAANIVSGTVVKVGDAANASRITQVTGTFSGIIPTGTSTITSNGTYDVASYASASVSVSSGEFYNIYKNIEEGRYLEASGCSTGNKYTSEEIVSWCNSFSNITAFFRGVIFSGQFTFNNVSTLNNAMYNFAYVNYAGMQGKATLIFPNVTNGNNSIFYSNQNIKEVQMPKITTLGAGTFYECNYLTSANFPSCTSIGNSVFFSCDSLTTISFPICTSINASAFCMCSRLTSAIFPSCTFIGSYAFSGCYSLSLISFPKCTSISSCAFQRCESLTTASFSVCMSIGSSAFQSCGSLTTISFPICTFIGTYAFYSCISLTSAIFPSCTSVGNYAFQSCTELTTISFPACVNMGGYVFYSCIKLTNVSLPLCTLISNHTFYGCTQLSKVYLNNVQSISGSAFGNCYNLIELHLESVSSVPVLANTYAFTSTPLYNYSTSAGRWGSIFVPASLYASFQTAAVWSTASIKARLVSV